MQLGKTICNAKTGIFIFIEPSTILPAFHCSHKIQMHNLSMLTNTQNTQIFNIHRPHTCTLRLETKLFLFLSYFFMDAWTYVYATGHETSSAELGRTSSLFLHYGSQGLSSGPLTWQQASLSTESFRWLRNKNTLKGYIVYFLNFILCSIL